MSSGMQIMYIFCIYFFLSYFLICFTVVYSNVCPATYLKNLISAVSVLVSCCSIKSNSHTRVAISLLSYYLQQCQRHRATMREIT